VITFPTVNQYLAKNIAEKICNKLTHGNFARIRHVQLVYIVK